MKLSHYFNSAACPVFRRYSFSIFTEWAGYQPAWEIPIEIGCKLLISLRISRPQPGSVESITTPEVDWNKVSSD